MEENVKVCKNCSYAVYRDKSKLFPWCPYECTYEDSQEERSRIPYKYENDTCSHFLATDKIL